MAYNRKTILRDEGGSPVPQFFDPLIDDFQPLTGVELSTGRYGYDSLIWGKTAGGVYVPLQVMTDGSVATQAMGRTTVVEATITSADINIHPLTASSTPVGSGTNLIAPATNTGIVYVGGSTAPQYPLYPGDSVTININDLANYYYQVDTISDQLIYSGVV